MPSHVVVNGLGLTYKGTSGISTATIPDVCKTPSPGGPVPIPYPNIAQQSSLDGGTTTVFAKGKMIANKGSHYSRSNGDEAGTVGGVKSNVNMKATDWITYSFDVMMDGKNACRHTDKKFHNNQNAADLQGNFDPLAASETLQDILCNCVATTPPEPNEWCTQYGERVDECCQQAIANLPQPAAFGGERGYDANNQPVLQNGNVIRRQAAMNANIDITGTSWPDACAMDDQGNIAQFFDFKTTCPQGHPYDDRTDKYGRHQKASGNRTESFANHWLRFNTPNRRRPSQYERYRQVGQSLTPPTQQNPQIIHDSGC